MVVCEGLPYQVRCFLKGCEGPKITPSRRVKEKENLEKLESSFFFCLIDYLWLYPISICFVTLTETFGLTYINLSPKICRFTFNEKNRKIHILFSGLYLL